MHFDVFRLGLATLLDLPTELLDEIALILPVRSSLVLMRSCSRIHDVVARLLYRDVKLSGYKSRRFLTSILSQSPSSYLYGGYIQTFEYSTTNMDDACLTYPILCNALARSFNIRELSLSLPSDTADFIKTLLKKAQIVRDSIDIFLSSDGFLRGGATETRMTLPHVERLVIRGDLGLAGVARLRKVKTIEIMDVISFRDLTSVVKTIRGQSDTYPSLHSISISLDITSCESMYFMLHGLNEVFPNLVDITIHSRHVNALVSPS